MNPFRAPPPHPPLPAPARANLAQAFAFGLHLTGWSWRFTTIAVSFLNACWVLHAGRPLYGFPPVFIVFVSTILVEPIQFAATIGWLVSGERESA